jgi:RNA polymerase sigma factor (sigma-70 family)
MDDLLSATAEPAWASRAAAAYAKNYNLLRFIARDRFQLPDDEVRAVIHDVFLAFIRNAEKIGLTVDDERAWLVGTTCNTCRYYWRKRRDVPLPADMGQRVDPVEMAREALARITVARVLRQLPARCRSVLRRRFAEGYSSKEIAASEAITCGSAKNLISKCLRAAREAVSRAEKA